MDSVPFKNKPRSQSHFIVNRDRFVANITVKNFFTVSFVVFHPPVF
jgi:hypothetical protein